MIEQWILTKIDSLRSEPLILLRDPQRMIRRGARVVDGWAEENGYTVLFCTGNLGLREMYEAMRDDTEARVLLVDRSREGARVPLFYPDLAASASPHCRMELTLRDYLVEQTGDPNWPHLVNDRNLSHLILAHVRGILHAHEQLRQVSASRFTDTDLYQIVLGAALEINPFRALSAADIRRLCLEQHRELDELKSLVPDQVMETLRQTIRRAPRPFCWLLERDAALVVRAFTLSAIMRQHGLEYQVLLANLDPALHEYREIDPAFLDQAMLEHMKADPDQVMADVQDVDRFLQEDPARLAFLLRDRLGVSDVPIRDDPQRALAVLETERLSPLIRGMALFSLLADLLENKQVEFHAQVVDLLDGQAGQAASPAWRRPAEQWLALESAYRQAVTVYRLAARLIEHAKVLKVMPAEELTFAEFDQLWNQEHLNRLDYYTSSLERALRVADLLPARWNRLWPELQGRWTSARQALKKVSQAIGQVQNLIDARFQDLYRLRYKAWIRQSDAPMVFTHQFLSRLVQAHWDPQSGRKAVVMVFDGLRTDAWDELLRPVFEERFEVIESRPGSALIPTETQLSRKAISAGCLPEAFTSTRELVLLQSWLQEHLGLNVRFDVVQDDDTVASGMSVRYVSDRFEYIVLNFTDQNLHRNPQDLAFIYNSTVREIIRQDVRSVLRELPDDVLLFVTSDHGFTPIPGPTVTVPERVVADVHDIKYRYAGTADHLEEADRPHVVEFDARVLGIKPVSETIQSKPIRYIVFPRPGYTLRRPTGSHDPDRYTHGGLSLAECSVPMVVLGPRRAEQPLLWIESVQQVGSVSEGEELEIEVAVAATNAAPPDLAIALSFSRDEIPGRREVLSGKRATYAIRWMPNLGEIGDADRQQGTVVQSVTVILTYRNPVSEGEIVRLSKTTEVRIKLDPTRLHRRVDSKLDLLMGKVPKGLKG